MQLYDAIKRLADLYQDATPQHRDAAFRLYAQDCVRHDRADRYTVEDEGTRYTVQGQACSCAPLQEPGETALPCAHGMAAQLFQLLQDETPQHDASGVPVLRSIRAIVADLSQPLPKECVATKTLKGTPIAYLHWQTVSRMLDAYAPGWSGQIARIDQLGTAIAVTYRLTLPCVEGTVSREATGQEDEDHEGYGDSTSNAEAMAFKRAAAKFGVGLWLYDKDATAQALERHIAGVPARSGVAPKDRPVPAMHEAPANGTAWRAVLIQYQEDTRLTEGLRTQIKRALQTDTNQARGTALAATVQQAVKAQA